MDEFTKILSNAAADIEEQLPFLDAIEYLVVTG